MIRVSDRNHERTPREAPKVIGHLFQCSNGIADSNTQTTQFIPTTDKGRAELSKIVALLMSGEELRVVPLQSYKSLVFVRGNHYQDKTKLSFSNKFILFQEIYLIVANANDIDPNY